MGMEDLMGAVRNNTMYGNLHCTVLCRLIDTKQPRTKDQGLEEYIDWASLLRSKVHGLQGDLIGVPGFGLACRCL